MTAIERGGPLLTGPNSIAVSTALSPAGSRRVSDAATGLPTANGSLAPTSLSGRDFIAKSMEWRRKSQTMLLSRSRAGSMEGVQLDYDNQSLSGSSTNPSSGRESLSAGGQHSAIPLIISPSPVTTTTLLSNDPGDKNEQISQRRVSMLVKTNDLGDTATGIGVPRSRRTSALTTPNENPTLLVASNLTNTNSERKTKGERSNGKASHGTNKAHARKQPQLIRRYRDYNTVSKERMNILWNLVRTHFLQQKLNFFSLLSQSKPIPYTVTIRQGFQFKHRFRTKYQIKCAAMHPRVPWHEGRLRGGTKGGFFQDSDDDEPTPEKENEMVDASGKKVKKVVTYAFVAADSSHTIRMWEATRNATGKPNLVVKVPVDIFQLVFIPRLGIYCTSSNDKDIKFFTPRFELINAFETIHHTQFLLYNPLTQELVTIGSHFIATWTLRQVFDRGGVRIEPELHHFIETKLAPEEWITAVSLMDKTNKIYAIANTKVLLYDLHSGQELNRLLYVSQRQINCVVYYDRYDYTIIGCTNGAIKIFNMNNSMVHEFANHTKAVTALAIYPYGPIIISSALDYTVRMFNLKTFKEVYCLHLRENPTGLQVIDDQQLYVTTRESIMVWGLNHINSGFSTINTRVTRLLRSTTSNYPARILVRSEDGAIRLISPISGKVITTSLPLLETDKVVDMAHCAKIAEKLFLLLNNNEIWVVATNVNPCVVIDIWTLTNAAKEDISCLTVWDGHFTAFDDCPPNYERSNGYVLVMAGTRNGQVLLFSTRGSVIDRYQIHVGCITQLATDTRQQIIVTSGEDFYIRVSSVNPLNKNVITVKVSIPTQVIPRMISLMENCVCLTADDFSLTMYTFNAVRCEWDSVQPHSRSDDHSDAITALTSIGKLGLFVTISRDSTLRVWDVYNTLVREIQFQEPLDSLCLASSRGDILIGIQNRIDIINYALYLPPGYIKTVQNMEWVEKAAETPITFDESFDFLKNYAARRHIHYHYHSHQNRSDIYRYEQFHRLNFLINDLENLSGSSYQLSMQKLDAEMRSKGWGGSIDDMTYKNLMVRLNALNDRRNKLIKQEKQRLEQESNQMEATDQTLHEEFERYVKYKHIADSLRKPIPEPIPPVEDIATCFLERFGLMERNVVEEYRPEPAAKSLAFSTPEDEIRVIEISDTGLEIPIIRPSTPDPIRPDERIEVAAMEEKISSEMPVNQTPEAILEKTISIEEIIEHLRRDGKLLIAPDGEIPNSILAKLIDEWKASHKGYKVIEGVITKKVEKKVEHVNHDPEKSKKSEMYKARLKEMLKEKEERESKEAEALKKEQETEQEHQAAEHSDEDDKIDVTSSVSQAKKRLPNGQKLRTAQMDRYPKIIEHALDYTWFPKEEIFFPSQSSSSENQTSTPAKESRKLKVDPTSESLLPLILDVFRKETSPTIRLEIVEYLNWMVEFFGFRDTTAIVRVFCRYLQNSMLVRCDAAEEELQYYILESLLKFGTTQVELIPTLLALATSDVDRIRRRKACEELSTLGVHKPDSKYVNDKILLFFASAELIARQDTGSTNNLTNIENNKSITDLRKDMSAFLSQRPSLNIQMGNMLGASSRRLPTTAVQIVQSPAALDLRNNIMSWLRKILRRFLIKITRDPELNKRLRELNDSGIVDKSRKNEVLEADDEDNFEEERDKLRVEPTPRRNSEHGIKKNGRRASITTKAVKGVTSVSRRGSLMPGRPASPPKGLSIGRPQSPAAIREEEDTSNTLPIIVMNEDPIDTKFAPESQPSPTTAIETDKLTRGPVATLQNPSIQDFIMVLNFYTDFHEMKALRAEQERIEKLQRELRAAEEARLERERQLLAEELKRQREAERLARLAARKASRFPPLDNTKGYSSTIAVHLRKMTKAMPLENVNLTPFEEESPKPIRPMSSTPSLLPKPLIVTTGVSRPCTSHHSHQNHSSEEYHELVPSWKEFSLDTSNSPAIDRLVSDEFEYVRNGRPPSRQQGSSNGRPQSQQKYKTQRKYFVFDLADPDNDRR
ncbi:hypothetical protein HDV05_003248 [Chytridiales sp. JEL 0842]|nr:hypothetical protein HDV05_003248 [Chytridiales sp. JEL 0842]